MVFKTPFVDICHVKESKETKLKKHKIKLFV